MKKLIINLKTSARAIHSKAEISKSAVRKLYWFIEGDGGNTPLKLVPAKLVACRHLSLDVGDLGGVRLGLEPIDQRRARLSDVLKQFDCCAGGLGLPLRRTFLQLLHHRAHLFGRFMLGLGMILLRVAGLILQALDQRAGRLAQLLHHRHGQLG